MSKPDMTPQANPLTETLTWDLADRLRKALADIGVQEMADHLEMGRNSVGNYINGRTTPQPSTLKVWAVRCGVPYSWLRDGVIPTDGPDDHGSAVTPWFKENGNVIELHPACWDDDDIDAPKSA